MKAQSDYVTDRAEKARQIQAQIRQVLFADWDPVGVNDLVDSQGESDSCIGGIYRRLSNGESEERIAAHLDDLERNQIGTNGSSSEERLRIARKPLSLDIRL